MYYSFNYNYIMLGEHLRMEQAFQTLETHLSNQPNPVSIPSSEWIVTIFKDAFIFSPKSKAAWCYMVRGEEVTGYIPAFVNDLDAYERLFTR